MDLDKLMKIRAIRRPVGGDVKDAAALDVRAIGKARGRIVRRTLRPAAGIDDASSVRALATRLRERRGR